PPPPGLRAGGGQPIVVATTSSNGDASEGRKMTRTDHETAQLGGAFAHLRLVIIGIAAAGVLLCAWLVGGGGGASSSGSKPVASSARDIHALPDSVGHAVYWPGAS